MWGSATLATEEFSTTMNVGGHDGDGDHPAIGGRNPGGGLNFSCRRNCRSQRRGRGWVRGAEGEDIQRALARRGLEAERGSRITLICSGAWGAAEVRGPLARGSTPGSGAVLVVDYPPSPLGGGCGKRLKTEGRNFVVELDNRAASRSARRKSRKLSAGSRISKSRQCKRSAWADLQRRQCSSIFRIPIWIKFGGVRNGPGGVASG